VFCGLSALALKTNAPTVLREEALGYKRGAVVVVGGGGGVVVVGVVVVVVLLS